jgi:hypothetical protein
MGVGLFFRIPVVMEQVMRLPHFAPVAVFIRICFYIMGALLVGGGIRKLYGIWCVGGRAGSSRNGQ